MPRLLLLLIVFLLPAIDAAAQHHRIIHVEDWTYEHIQRLQRRGHLLELDPTNLPYRHQEVQRALARLDVGALTDQERHWTTLLQQAFSTPQQTASDEMYLYADVDAGLTAADTRRYDVLRPLDESYPVLPDVGIRMYVEKGPFAAQFGARHNYHFVDDPDGLPAGRRLHARNEDSYVGFRSPLLDLTLGRFSNQWGLAREMAPVVSTNPRSYDQLNVRLGGDRLRLSAILGELDNITADDRYTGEAFLPGSKRRYLSARRFDWRPTPAFQLSVIDAILYSGQNAGLTPRYLNPLTTAVFSVANTPVNDEVNGLIAAAMWLHFRNVTLYGQFLVDDIHLMDTIEPASTAFIGSVYAADVLPFTSLGVTTDFVTARTYNTHFAEGQYIYLNRGLATQFSDYIHATLFADFEMAGALRGLTLTPRVHALWQGEMDMRDVFPAQEDAPLILSGTPERTLRGALQLYYQRSPHWWLRLDTGMNTVADAGHVPGATRVRPATLLEFGARFALDGRYRLSF